MNALLTPVSFFDASATAPYVMGNIMKGTDSMPRKIRVNPYARSNAAALSGFCMKAYGAIRARAKITSPNPTRNLERLRAIILRKFDFRSP